MKTYTWKCTMADGRVYCPRRKFPYRAARAAMAEDRKVFTGCKDWQLVANQ